MTREHGGPDAAGVARWDFSTNGNGCGPCPMALAAVQRADPCRYPDPAYTQLCAALAAFHGVAPSRIVPAASASEFIVRITSAVARAGGRQAWRPPQAYGDYAQAARACGLQAADSPWQADLLWLCEPSSPLGASEPVSLPPGDLAAAGQPVVVLDRAYEPLRLAGTCTLAEPALDGLWQLWSPNKALGLTGIRGAYAIAPMHPPAILATVAALAPSWPLGAHAVALLQAWAQPDTQQWLVQCREQLREWKATQTAMLHALGWTCLPGDASFLCARPPAPQDAAALRARGLKLRDAASLGLPGHWRLNVMPPEAQEALRAALESTVAASAPRGPLQP